jgi:plastocyanin
MGMSVAYLAEQLRYYQCVPATASTPVGAMAAAIIATMAVSCGSQTPTSPAPSGQVHTVISTVMLESTGPNPREITIAVGETVSFMNHENVPYTVAGGAGPAQSGCPEIAAVGLLSPGEIRPTAPFSMAKTCDYHVPNGQAVLFSGRIVVR